MANEEKVMELLRRAHTVIGEGLIENALDESAEGLHNEIGDALGLRAIEEKPTTPETRTRKTRTVAVVDDLLRGKLTDIRDEAMELSAILEFAKPDGAAADPLWKFAQTVIEETEALLPFAHKSGVAEPVAESELLDELRNSLLARCESCCKGLEHDDEHCGAPTARRLLSRASRSIKGAL